MAFEKIDVQVATTVGTITRYADCSFKGEFNAAQTALLGIELESPDGLTTKALSMDNSGNLLWGGSAVAMV